MYSTAELLNIPSAPAAFRDENTAKYPELQTDSTNYRIKKIMDDEKFLQDEIKMRQSMCKKYGRFATLTDTVEYTLIVGDIVVGTACAVLPGVGNLISSATFSGVGLISGMAKMIQSKINEKRMKHYKLFIEATTTLNNLHHKFSKAYNDGQITHEEFEEIQNVIRDWKDKDMKNKHTTLSPETMKLIDQQAFEKAQKEILAKLKASRLTNNNLV